MSSTAQPSPKRMYSLDVLRGLACSLVLAGHLPVNYEGMNPICAAAISSVRRSGAWGVDLFFVLSGLLISGLLFKELQSRGSIGYRRFWLRRGLKIWPAYFAIFGVWLAACAGESWIIHGANGLGPLYQSILPNTFFVQNYVECLRWPHSWSLAVEEHFYTLLPLLLIGLVAAKRLQWLPALIGGICVAVLGLRLTAAAGGATWEAIKYPSHYHVDALLFGVLLGYLFAYYPKKLERLRPCWPAAIAACLGVMIVSKLVMFKHHPVIYSITFTAVYLAFGSLVLMARLYPQWGTRGPRWLRAIPSMLAYVGVYSYTIYLAHGVVFKLPYLRATLEWIEHPAWAPALFVAGSIGGGILLSHMVERPMLRLRDRWVPAASKLQLGPTILPIASGVQAGLPALKVDADRRAA